MKLCATPLAGLMVADTVRLGDTRGWFARLFCERELATVIGKRRIVQINLSHSAMAGTVRGMHYQRAPHAEMKLVRCTRGRVWDVALDLRAGSPTFLHWHAEKLSPDNGRMLIIPEGVAHGFQVLDPDSELLYLHSAPYEPAAEGAVHYLDRRAAIGWPLAVTEVSTRDANHPPLAADFSGLVL